jgi:hypothetical protein
LTLLKMPSALDDAFLTPNMHARIAFDGGV